MIWHWFKSKTVRRAVEMSKHARKLLNAQIDLLSAEAVSNLSNSIARLDEAVRTRMNKEAVLSRMNDLEKAAGKSLKPYPHPGLRENIEVLLVAIAVAMGVRTFFLQPFKIPTGSMQPTLYGITPSPPPMGPGNIPDLEVPNRLGRFLEFWSKGVSYYHEVADSEGTITAVDRPRKFLLFNLKQRYQFNGRWRSIWFPDDTVFERAGVAGRNSFGGYEITQHVFRPGEDILRLKINSGDHLFVDRFTYNFRRPKRGEIIVFETKGIQDLQQDQFYIKRLVALGGETISIGSDRHAMIDGRRLDAATPRFENVYGFTNVQPRESEYSGHTPIGMFSEEKSKFTVGTNRFLVMGDNTMNSLDSRMWGDLPQTNVIGKSYFVYWPFTSRFGWSVR